MRRSLKTIGVLLAGEGSDGQCRGRIANEKHREVFCPRRPDCHGPWICCVLRVVVFRRTQIIDSELVRAVHGYLERDDDPLSGDLALDYRRLPVGQRVDCGRLPNSATVRVDLWVSYRQMGFPFGLWANTFVDKRDNTAVGAGDVPSRLMPTPRTTFRMDACVCRSRFG